MEATVPSREAVRRGWQAHAAELGQHGRFDGLDDRLLG